jgi:hypothetical protein
VPNFGNMGFGFLARRHDWYADDRDALKAGIKKGN